MKQYLSKHRVNSKFDMNIHQLPGEQNQTDILKGNVFFHPIHCMEYLIRSLEKVNQIPLLSPSS